MHSVTSVVSWHHGSGNWRTWVDVTNYGWSLNLNLSACLRYRCTITSLNFKLRSNRVVSYSSAADNLKVEKSAIKSVQNLLRIHKNGAQNFHFLAQNSDNCNHKYNMTVILHILYCNTCIVLTTTDCRLFIAVRHCLWICVVILLHL